MNAQDLIERLARLLDETGPGLLAFDGDGTLWDGDVGDDALDVCLEAGLTPTAATAVRNLAVTVDVDATGSDGDVVESLLEAARTGRAPEASVFEMTAWVFAGRSPADVSAIAAEAMRRRGQLQRCRRPVLDVLEWAASRGLPVAVVSASNATVVTEAVRALPVVPVAIIGARPAVARGCLLPRLAAPLPYGPEKPRQLAALGGPALVAAFGDSAFDGDLLDAAPLAVAVAPRPGLRRHLQGHPYAVELDVGGAS